MIFATEAARGQSCYIRFFNGAIGIETADVFVNNELVVQNLAYGAFSDYHKAKPGAYNIKVRIVRGNSDVEYSELVSLMEDTAYTMAMAGDAGHLDVVMITMDMRKDVPRPNVRFANLIPYDSVVDIEIDKQTAVWGLMYKEASDHIQIEKDNLELLVTVINSDDEKILEDGLKIEADASLLAIISGSTSLPQSPPQMHSAEDSPVL